MVFINFTFHCISYYLKNFHISTYTHIPNILYKIRITNRKTNSCAINLSKSVSCGQEESNVEEQRCATLTRKTNVGHTRMLEMNGKSDQAALVRKSARGWEIPRENSPVL